jgi:ribonucleoside-diphosphate reductase alpha chain
MPTGYAGEGRKWSKKEGRWKKTEKEKAFDYDALNQRSAALLVSFYRYYPDLFFDLIRSKNAKYKLELPQRIMMRIFARYRNVYITGSRGLTKTFTLVASKQHDGMFFPGEKIRYTAPSQKQSAALASQAFKDIAHDYPVLSKCWNINNDRDSMFRISTVYGSEFTMYAPRGDNCSQVVAEEMGQEGEDGFDMENYEKNISPTCRIVRKVNKMDDRTHIHLKQSHIANACSRQNPAFYKYRANALKDMIYGDKYDGYAIDMSWITSLLCNIRDIAYFKKEKRSLTPENWLREMCVRYIGNGVDPLIPDDVLARSKKLMVMENKHCGDPNAIYIVSHDVSYVDGQKNAKCADVVLKLTKYDHINKRDKYRKQAVFADVYPPPKTDYDQARRLKDLWSRYCMNGGQTTYMVIDAHTYGTSVIEELMKPTTDGSPVLCCYNHMRFTEIEQPMALPVIYPLKAATRGATDADGDMIRYAQLEFSQENVELLTTNLLDGIESYKNFHGIKDESSDSKIIQPYRVTDELCQQIQNLQTVVSGLSTKEKRKSKSIQRDIWSALKYGLRMSQILEGFLSKEKYKAKSSWSGVIADYENGKRTLGSQLHQENVRSNLLSLRRR